MKKLLFTLALAAALPLAAVASDKDADNSGKNKRDRGSDNKTPLDQSNDPADLKITQDIRKAIVDDKSLTMTAKNVKIITVAGGLVTLRGPVNTAEEKTRIESVAKAVAGETKVTSQLEVKQ